PGAVVREARLLSERNAVNPFMFGLKGYHSDGAREFPWLHTAGLDGSANGYAEKFVAPPEAGRLARVRYRDRQSDPLHFPAESANVKGPQMGWEYAPGTLFGEV